MNKATRVSIIVKRKTRVSDGQGRYVATYSKIIGSPFIGNLIRARKPVFIEGRPGDVVVDNLVLVFPAGADILPDDVCEVGSSVYTVQTVRSYTSGIQADVIEVK